MDNNNDAESLLPYIGIGGIAVCCLGIELLGGAVVLGGLAATIGLSTEMTYLIVTGVGGLIITLFVVGARQFKKKTRI